MADSTRWAGLLRAVNVGGRQLTMAKLKAAAESAGFEDVATLLASGNVTFSGGGSEKAIRGKLEKALSEEAGFAIEVMLRRKPQLQKLLKANLFPDGSGSKVLIGFLDGTAPAGLADKLAEVAINERIEVAGKEVWIDFVDGVGRSKLAAKLPALCKPRLVTARNVNTVAKLVDKL